MQPISQDNLCIYCGRRQEKMSLEHIWPQALGGDDAPDLFLTRNVCMDCNSRCGLFVDAPFIKSWFMKGAEALDSLWYADLDLKARTTIPPIYWGRITDDLELGPELCCETWLSACRGVILHIHPNMTERYSAYSGGNPIQQRKTPGIAYFFNKATNLNWVALGLRSFRHHFRRQDRVLANVRLADDAQHQAFGRIPDPTDVSFIKKIVAKYGETLSVPVGFSVQLGAETRFLAKLALGLGYKIGGSNFLESRYAQRLRAHLNEPDPSKRPSISASEMLRETDNSDYFHRTLRWRGGVVMYFSMSGDIAGVHLSIWGRHATVALSDEARRVFPNWESHIPAEGAVFVIVPQIGYFSPPIRAMEFIAHMQGRMVSPELRRAEQGRLSSLEDLPPKNPEEEALSPGTSVEDEGSQV